MRADQIEQQALINVSVIYSMEFSKEQLNEMGLSKICADTK